MDWNILVLVAVLVFVFGLFFYSAKRRQNLMERRKKEASNEDIGCKTMIREKDLPK